MSNGYDFFGAAGGASAPPVRSDAEETPPPVDRWGMPVTAAAFQATQATQSPPPAYPSPGFSAPTWQQPPGKPAKNLPMVIGGIVLAAAVAAGAVFYLSRSHPVSLPSTAGGMGELTSLTASDRADLKDAQNQLAKKAHIHDIASRFYGDVNSGGYFIIAGHINGSNASMADVENQIASSAAGAGASFSTGTVRSGSTDFECVWASSGGHEVSVCFWWSNRSVLFGEGLGYDAQSTADALAGVRAYAGLN